MDQLAEEYVKIVLEVGTHDDGYVDAYYGPPAWKEESAMNPRTLEQLSSAISLLRTQFEELRIRQTSSPLSEEDSELQRLRVVFMDKQITATQTFVKELIVKELIVKESDNGNGNGNGGEVVKRLDFDEESRLLYDAVAPTQTEDDFKVSPPLYCVLLVMPMRGRARHLFFEFEENYLSCV
jgi:hypothetical protein